MMRLQREIRGCRKLADKLGSWRLAWTAAESTVDNVVWNGTQLYMSRRAMLAGSKFSHKPLYVDFDLDRT